MFNGSIVALVTPMDSDGAIDIPSFRELILWHISAGTNGIVVNGTTGEGATLSREERIELLTAAVETAAGRIPIIAGTGSASTMATVQETRAASDCGVDACMVVTPYYNRPTQEGLALHYTAVAESTELPVLVYNVPSRTGCDLQPATLAGLAHIKNIVGIKDATGDITRVAAMQALAGDRFCLLSGDDLSSLDFVRAGGNGVVSVTANLTPELMQKTMELGLNGNFADAEQINDSLSLLHRALMAETNPIPTKWALARLNKIKEGIRLPLTPLTQPMHNLVLEALNKAGIFVSEEQCTISR